MGAKDNSDFLKYIDDLHDDDNEVRKTAVDIICYFLKIVPISIQRRAVKPLIKVLKNDEYGGMRSYAASALGNIGDKRAVEPLIEALRNDEYEVVRSNAASALGNIGDKQSLGLLLRVLRIEHDNVRYSAATALGRIGDKSAVEPLIEALRNDEYEGVRSNAASALGDIGDKRAIDPLIEALRTDEDMAVKDSSAHSLIYPKGAMNFLKDDERYVIEAQRMIILAQRHRTRMRDQKRML